MNLNPAVDPEGVSRPLDLIEVPTAAHLTQRVIRCCSVSGSGVKPSQETMAPTAGFRLNDFRTIWLDLGPSREGNDRLMFIGLTKGLRALEIGIELIGDDEYVFHAMDAVDHYPKEFDDAQ